MHSYPVSVRKTCKEIPDGHMAFGNPMKIRREVTEEELQGNLESAAHYQKLAQKTLA